MKQEAPPRPDAPDQSPFDEGELSTNYDYHLATKGEKLPPSPVDDLRLIGRVAQIFTDGKKVQERFDKVAKWWKGKRAQWRGEKAQHKEDLAYRGSLAELSDSIVPYHEAYEQRQQGPVAQPVPDRPGVYQSNFSTPEQPIHQPEAPIDDIWDAAVQRARASLGELPVFHSAPPVVPGRREVNDEIVRLEEAFNQPAAEPDRSQHVGRHRAPDTEDDNQLVTTNGK